MTKHALKRLRERIHQQAGDGAIQWLRGQIMGGNSRMVRAQRDGCELHHVEMFGKRVRVIWHPAGRRVVTILPDNITRKKRERLEGDDG